jgi:hypothetical protein
MKKASLVSVLVISLLVVYSGCSNVCQDTHSVNFNQAGKCIDLASNITGNYSGTLRDSLASAVTQYSVILKVSKVNNSNVSVQLVSPAATPFTAFSATVVSSADGYYLAINADSSVKGAAVAYGSPADGIYVSLSRQLSVYAESTGGTFEAFTGTKQ